MNETGKGGGGNWDVLVGGEIHAGLDDAEIWKQIREGKLQKDTMVRRSGGEWAFLVSFPELNVVQEGREKQQAAVVKTEHAWWKGMAVAIPVGAVFGLLASVMFTMEEWAFGLIAEYVLPRYLGLSAILGLAGSLLHVQMLNQGYRGGFWRYVNVAPAAAVLTGGMYLTQTPPIFPLPFVAALFITALCLVGVVFFIYIILFCKDVDVH